LEELSRAFFGVSDPEVLFFYRVASPNFFFYSEGTIANFFFYSESTIAFFFPSKGGEISLLEVTKELGLQV
jgi:hypothetical protein